MRKGKQWQYWSAEQTVFSSEFFSVIKMNPLSFIKVIMRSASMYCTLVHLFPALSGNAMISFAMLCDKPTYYISVWRKREVRKMIVTMRISFPPHELLYHCWVVVTTLARNLLLLFDSAHTAQQCSCLSQCTAIQQTPWNLQIFLIIASCTSSLPTWKPCAWLLVGTKQT